MAQAREGNPEQGSGGRGRLMEAVAGGPLSQGTPRLQVLEAPWELCSGGPEVQGSDRVSTSHMYQLNLGKVQ